jgi:putative hemolysin
VFSLVTYPIVKLLSVSTSLIMKLLPVKESQGDRLSEEELRAMIRTANTQGLLDMQETEAHQNLFRFSEQVARTLMTHRSEVEWVDSTEPRVGAHRAGEGQYPFQIPRVPRERG